MLDAVCVGLPVAVVTAVVVCVDTAVADPVTDGVEVNERVGVAVADDVGVELSVVAPDMDTVDDAVLVAVILSEDVAVEVCVEVAVATHVPQSIWQFLRKIDPRIGSLHLAGFLPQVISSLRPLHIPVVEELVLVVVVVVWHVSQRTGHCSLTASPNMSVRAQ